MAIEPAIPVIAARWMVAGEWRAHPARLAIGALAIAVGVALGFAVHLVNRSALSSFDAAMRSVNGAADLQVRGVTPRGFNEALFPKLARIEGVAAVSPVVELAARSGAVVVPGTAGSGSGRITLIGIDVLRAVRVTPSLVGMPANNGAATGFDPNAIFVSRAALEAMDKQLGDPVTIVAAGIPHRFIIRGVLAAAGDAQPIGVIDIADAQWLFGQLGRLQRVDIRLAEGANRDTVSARIAAILPADAEIGSPASDAQRSDSLSRAYRVNLEMLAMVALLTGGFLVFSAQSLSVARRRPQFALLRVLGLKRQALVVQIVVEGAIVGVIGAGLGIAIGYGLAILAITLLGGDLGGGYFGRHQVNLAFAPLAAAVFAAIGIVTAIAASLVPAREAAQAQPAIALKSRGDDGDPRTRPQGAIGVLLVGLGGLAALAPPIAGLPIAGYTAMALLLAGGVAAMPFLARLLLAPLHRLSGLPVPIDLALKRLWGAPGQAGVALCGIVASTSLMVAMAVMVSSFRGSVDDWLVAILPSDIYLHLEGVEAGGLDAGAQARLAATPGVASIRFVRQVPLRLAPDKPAVMLSGQTIDGHGMPMLAKPLPVPQGSVGAYASEPLAWIYGVKPGDTLLLPLGGRQYKVFIAGIWRDYARQFGAIALSSEDFARLTGDASKSEAAIDVAPGASMPATISALRSRLPAGLASQALFAEPRQMRRVALQIFDRSFAITYALEAIAITIGLIGVAATFSAQTLARTREFGMLRHIGVKRGQIIAMLAAEGALLGLIGVVAGIGLGLVMSQVLIHVVNPQSFHWTMDTSLPWGLLASLVLALVIAAAGTAVAAGRQALNAGAIRAVREDW